MRLWVVLAGAAALLLGGCSSPGFVGRPGLILAQNGELPPPNRTDLASGERPVVIGPFDQLSVEVFGLAELTRTVQVDANGRVSLPLAGTMDTSGKTPAELAAAVEERLRAQHVRDPRVTVNITEVVSQVVTVDGEVREPGMYPVAGRLTLMRAIAQAKGLTEFARQNHVVVFRTVESQNMAALYDLRSIRRGMYQDPEIFANDVVVVSDSQARRLFRDIIQGSGLLTTPIIALLQR